MGRWRIWRAKIRTKDRLMIPTPTDRTERGLYVEALKESKKGNRLTVWCDQDEGEETRWVVARVRMIDYIQFDSGKVQG